MDSNGALVGHFKATFVGAFHVGLNQKNALMLVTPDDWHKPFTSSKPTETRITSQYPVIE
jgi:hypothetical protein